MVLPSSAFGRSRGVARLFIHTPWRSGSPYDVMGRTHVFEDDGAICKPLASTDEVHKTAARPIRTKCMMHSQNALRIAMDTPNVVILGSLMAPRLGENVTIPDGKLTAPRRMPSGC